MRLTRSKQGQRHRRVRRCRARRRPFEGHSTLSQDHIYSGFNQLVQNTNIPANPDGARLERVPNPQAGMRYAVRFTAPEFTSLCPVTGQPDFAHLVVAYLPGDWLVESKSLKPHLISFRNHDSFHDACIVSIGRRLPALLAPQWLRTGCYWYPLGSLPAT